MNGASRVDPLPLHDVRRRQHRTQGEEGQEEEGEADEDQQRQLRVKFAPESGEEADRLGPMRQTTIIRRNPLLRITVTEDQRTKDFYRNDHIPLLLAVSERPVDLCLDLCSLCIPIERDEQRGTKTFPSISSSCSSFALAEKVDSEEKHQGRRTSNAPLVSSVQFHVTP